MPDYMLLLHERPENFENLSPEEMQGIRLRRLIGIQLRRIPIWKDG